MRTRQRRREPDILRLRDIHLRRRADIGTGGARWRRKIPGPADRSALTIVAVNNGPDEPSVGAWVTGLPKGAQEIRVTQGSYDSSTGVWIVGELRLRGYYLSAGQPEPTLILGASAGETANVRIAYSKNYEVCVGPKSNPGNLAHTTKAACEAVDNASWNSVAVYDPKPANNTATIRAARGTSGRSARPGLAGGAPAPGNLRAQARTTTVTWDVEYLYGIPVEGYEIEELQGSSWTRLAMAAHNQYAVTQPRGSNYRVRAVNAAEQKGPWSRSTSEVRAALAGPPLNVTTQADGENAIDVSWAAPADTGGSANTGYTVQWSADGSSNWRSAGSRPATTLTFKQRGLQTGAVRWYRVAARNSGGLGLWSDPAQGQPITGYELEWSADGSTDWQALATPGADDTSYTDGTLGPSTRRYYRMRAKNSVGNGAWSRPDSATTQEEAPLTPARSAEADGRDAILVSWEEPFAFEGVRSVTQYELQWARDPSSEIWAGSKKFGSSMLSWRHTRLQAGETWYYRVRATNGGNRWSVWSYTASATTASEGVPTAAPTSLMAAYDVASHNVTLTWNQPSGTITGYDVQSSEDNSQWQDLTTEFGALTYTDEGYFYPGSEVYYRVRAVNGHGAGPWTTSVKVAVPPNSPDAPRFTYVTADGSNHIVIEWEPPYSDGGAAITGYWLLWCRALDGADANRCQLSESNSPANPRGYSAVSLGTSARSYTHSVSPGYYYYDLSRATNGGNRCAARGPDALGRRVYREPVGGGAALRSGCEGDRRRVRSGTARA